jgi:DNA-binding MarR family transcriptional regulator
MSQFYDVALAPVGIKSTQFSILLELYRSSVDGPVTVCELAATLGHNLRPLERDNLVRLRLAPDDKRKRCIELTAGGRTLLHRAWRLWRCAERKFEQVFGKQPAAELRAVLLHIANNRELDSNTTR